jgi:hypothetical protein
MNHPIDPSTLQTVQDVRVLGDGWTEFSVKTCTTQRELESIVLVRATKSSAPFVDVSIEEYVGISRRAKLTSVRLQENAARRLYALLAAKFDPAGTA